MRDREIEDVFPRDGEIRPPSRVSGLVVGVAPPSLGGEVEEGLRCCVVSVLCRTPLCSRVLGVCAIVSDRCEGVRIIEFIERVEGDRTSGIAAENVRVSGSGGTSTGRSVKGRPTVAWTAFSAKSATLGADPACDPSPSGTGALVAKYRFDIHAHTS